MTHQLPADLRGLEAVLESDSVGVAFLDRSLRIAAINPVLAGLARRTVDQVIGQLAGPWFAKRQPMLLRLIEKVWDTGQPAQRRQVVGKRHEAVVDLIPARKSDGTISHVLAIVVDVTEQRRFERVLELR